MNPNQPQPGAPAPTPQFQPAPTPAPAPVQPVNDPSAPAPFSLGTPGELPQQPAPQPQAEQTPAWAQQFITSMDERLTGVEAAISAETGTDPNAPIGTPQPGQTQPGTQSELAALNPRDWNDVDKYVNEKIQAGVQNGIQQFTDGINTQNTQAQQAKAQVDQELDNQVAALQNEGMLPPITNPNDRNDPGRIYRRELYGAAAKLGTTDLRAVAQLTLAPLHAQGKIYDPLTDSTIDYAPAQPGAQAPIGSSTTTTGQAPSGPSYKDIHQARSFDELRARAGMG